VLESARELGGNSSPLYIVSFNLGLFEEKIIEFSIIRSKLFAMY